MSLGLLYTLHRSRGLHLEGSIGLLPGYHETPK